MNDVEIISSRTFDVIATAEFFVKMVCQDGNKTIAVPGGSTPFPVFDALAAQDLDWAGITLLPTDDRVVPADHKASNFGRLNSILGDSGATVLPLQEDMEAPRFDMVWLGMGADGHIASLFPNTDPTLQAPATVIRLTPDPLPPEAPFDRLSWTLPALVNTNQAMLVIKGSEKRAVLDAALSGKNDLPIARLIAALSCHLTIFWSEI